MDVWEKEGVVDQLDQFLTNPEEVDTALSMIPSLFGISDKATYLGFRSLGFSPSQVLRVMGLDEDYLEYWRDTDPAFIEFEFRNLRKLQQECSTEILRLEFLKNMTMLVAKDSQIIRLASLDLDSLTKREYDYLTKVRAHYTPNDLLALEKALSPEKHKSNIVINLQWNNSITQPLNIDQEEDYHERVPLHDTEEEHEVLSLSEGHEVRLPDAS